MSDTTNDIDALLEYLGLIAIPESPRYHAALAALVAERNALRIELTNAKSYWRERAERRDAEQKSAADRDLRVEIDALRSSVAILTSRVAALECAKFVGPHGPVNPWNPYPTTPWIIYGTRTSDRIEESA